MLPPDAALGPYRITALIGEGGMGSVYRAKDTRLGRDVAVKVLTNVTLNDRERLQRFEQEARATGMLNHPNLLTIYDVGNHEGTPFLVSELLEGMSLRERLDRGALAPRKGLECALQMAQGLAAAHDKGIVHRDLKPDNVFLTRDGRVKILDFGIAKLTNPLEDGAFQSAATEPGMVLGTVGYMSPEQVRGEPVDHRSDIFAFGAILYEILTGRRAFKRNSSIETLSAILKEDPPELSESLPNVPPPVERLVRRCLEKDRDLRFQSARDLAFNLETLATMSNAGTMSRPIAAVDAPTTQMPSTPSSPRPATTIPPAPSPTAARPAHTSARPRPATTAVPARKAKRGVSPLLLGLLYLVSIGGAAFGGWWYAHRAKAAAGDVVFQRFTFRRGEVRGARFSADGETIVYSAAWDGQPPEIFIATRQSPEARPLGLMDAEVLAISKSTELAIMLRRDRLSGLGTLARVAQAGGMPRELADNVLYADWAADGNNLAAIRFVNGKYRVESPLGSVRYETPHPLRDLRVSPDGARLAWIEPHGGENDVTILGASGAPETIARGWGHGATGLAWKPDGTEIWITGTADVAPPSLYAVPLEGEPRLVSRVTGSMRLYDISPAGRVLLSNGTWRASLVYDPPGDEQPERDASWLDWSILADLSADGRFLLFNETREGGGARGAVYLRRLDAPAPIRIGDGYGDALSPDAKWVLSHNGNKLVLLPSGTGQARELKIAGDFDLGAAWLPDSRRAVLAGALPKKGYQLHVIDTLDEKVTPISPENVWGEATRPFAVSPDGRFVAGVSEQQTIALYPTDGSLAAVAVNGPEKGEVPIAFSADGLSLFVYRPTAIPAQVFLIELATGARAPWRTFAPADPAGVYKIAPLLITPDASAYAYSAVRSLSDLYVAEGLQ